jgi:hypothetical protein
MYFFKVNHHCNKKKMKVLVKNDTFKNNSFNILIIFQKSKQQFDSRAYYLSPTNKIN